MKEYWKKSKYSPFKAQSKQKKLPGKSNSIDDVLQHVQEMSELVLKAPQHADKRLKRQRKRESRERRLKGCDGNCKVAFTPSSLYRTKKKDLLIELDIHCLSTKGTVRQLAERLVEHYSEKVHPETPKWTKKMVQDALSLIPVKKSRAGRKRKRDSNVN